MALELGKATAASFLDHAKRERPRVNASYNRSMALARDYYRNYLREVTRAAKDKQELLEWDQVIEDLKGYEPDRGELAPLEEIVAELRTLVSKGKDEPEAADE